MVYDDGLGGRVRAFVGDDARISERKMFGGLCCGQPQYVRVRVVERSRTGGAEASPSDSD